MRAHGERRRIVQHEKEEHSAPSLHGLLIPNSTDNGRGAPLFLSISLSLSLFFSSFFFYADTLVERRTRVGV